jgi:hypothetical protein
MSLKPSTQKRIDRIAGRVADKLTEGQLAAQKPRPKPCQDSK